MASKPSFIFGRKPVLEALEQAGSIDKVLIGNYTSSVFQKEIIHLARNADVPFQFVPRGKLDGITGKNHQGVIAFNALVKYYSIDDVLAFVYEHGGTPLFLALDGVTDVGNFGAICRSALCMGVDAIIIPEKGNAQVTAQVVKASAGAVERVKIVREKKLRPVLTHLKENGIKIFTADMKGSSPESINMTAPCCIVMGSEELGVRKSIREIADASVAIEMPGDFDSLNVSVATGIVLYECFRQRKQ